MVLSVPFRQIIQIIIQRIKQRNLIGIDITFHITIPQIESFRLRMQGDRIENLIGNRKETIIIGTSFAIFHFTFQLVPPELIATFHKLIHPKYEVLANRHDRTDTKIFIQQISIVYHRPQFRLVPLEMYIHIRPFHHIFFRYACTKAILCQPYQQSIRRRIARLLPHFFNCFFQGHLIKQVNGITAFMPRLHPLKRHRLLLFQLTERQFTRHLQGLFERSRYSCISTASLSPDRLSTSNRTRPL